MSKAENIFKIIELRRSADLANALNKVMAYLTADCVRCPLRCTDDCAEKALPPAAQKPDEKRSYCRDWLKLHYLGDKA